MSSTFEFLFRVMKRSRDWDGHGNVLQPLVKNRITVRSFLKNSCGDRATELKSDIQKKTLKMMFDNSSNCPTAIGKLILKTVHFLQKIQ